MNKRGVSQTVVIIVLILLVLVAIGILAVVFFGIINQSSEGVSADTFSVSLSIDPSSVFVYNVSPVKQNVSVSVQRNSGNGELVAINFVIENATSNKVERVNTNLSELEKKTYSIGLGDMPSDSLISVTIYPIIITNRGEEAYTSSAIIYTFETQRVEIISSSSPRFIRFTSGSTPGGSNPPSCVPSCTGKQCGDNGCSGSCGTCNSGFNCINYQCIPTVCDVSSLAWNYTSVVNNTMVRLSSSSSNCNNLNYSIYENNSKSKVYGNNNTLGYVEWNATLYGSSQNYYYYGFVSKAENVSENATSSFLNVSKIIIIPPACVDNDLDGFNVTQTGCGIVDCNDTNSTIKPGASELCDGVDNNCVLGVDEGCSCINGQTKNCGTSVGLCEFGTQTCASGTWGSCVNSVGPVTEICDDGLDQDCNGFDLSCSGLAPSNWIIENTTKNFVSGVHKIFLQPQPYVPNGIDFIPFINSGEVPPLPAVGVSFIDSEGGHRFTRLTDVSAIPLAPSSTNPAAYNGSYFAGFNNGYARYHAVNVNSKYFIAFGSTNLAAVYHLSHQFSPHYLLKYT